MQKLWSYISAFLVGTTVILLGIVIYLLRNVKPVINADSYIESLDQKVGKLKQKGEGNEQTTKGKIQASVSDSGCTEGEAVQDTDKKAIRKQRKAEKKLNRKNRKQ